MGRSRLPSESLALSVRRREAYGRGDADEGLQHHETASIRTLYGFNVFAAVPLDGELTYAEIAKTVGVDESRMRRIMQYAMTNVFFAQTEDGHVIHNGVLYSHHST